MPRVSIVMPAYRAEAFLQEAIRSVIAQTFTDWELIIVDDGSPDNTAAVAAFWAANDPRIRLIRHGQRLGAAQSRNRAIAASSGELIAFLDADDIAYPQRIEKQVACLQNRPQTGMVAHWLDIVDGNSRPHGQQWEWRKEKDEHLPIFLLFGNAFALSSVMMRRRIWQRLNGFSSKFEPCEDYALWCEAAALTRMHVIAEKLGARREHAESLTNRFSEESQAQAERIIKSNLNRLGISPTDTQLHLHLQLRHREFEPDDDFARSARVWLEYLLRKNLEHRTYPATDFAEVIGEIWYDYWHRRHGEGISALRNYFGSPLWKGNNLKKNLLITALAIKKMLF